MGIAFFVTTGGAMGWLVGLVSGARGIGGVIFYMTAGIAAALICGILVSPLLESGSIAFDRDYTPSSAVISFVGTLLTLIAIGWIARRR